MVSGVGASTVNSDEPAVVALVKSDYYRAKFAGLQDQFEVGCEILAMDDAELETKLTHAIHAAWSCADNLRGPLLVSAALQIEQGRKAYERIVELVHV